MLNKQLFDFLLEISKETNKPIAEFILPSGLIQGKFKSYDQKMDTITLSDTIFSNIRTETDITFIAHFVQGWGKKELNL